MKTNAETQRPSVAVRGITNRLTLSGRAVWLVMIAIASPVLAVTYYATYKLNGGTATQSDETYSATATDTSAVWVTNSGKLTLNNCTVTTSGKSSSVDSSSQYGLNAGVLADSKGTLTMSGCSVTTSGSGANGLFATGAGAAVSLSNGTITTTGTASHGVDATYGGSITLANVTISTAADGASAGLSTDFGGGTVTVTGGTVTTAGTKSPAIYSTGVITVSGAKLVAIGGDGAVIDGANSIILTDTSLQGKLCGVKVHRTAKTSGSATVTITGGSLTATAGDAFLFAAESGSLTAAVTLKGGATVSTSSGCLVDATSGSTVTFTAEGETLTGSLIADSTSAVTAALKNGTVLTGKTTKAALTVDSTSAWAVPTASALTQLTMTGTISLGSPANTVTVTGAANLGGSLVVGTGSVTPAVGTYTLIQAGTVSGTFSSLTLPSGLTGTLNYSATAVTLSIAQAQVTPSLSHPWGIAVDSSGVLYVADSNDNTVRKITSDGVVTTLAGGVGLAGSTDANGTEARFNHPTGIAIDIIGNLYVADSNNNTIRKITADGVVTTLAGGVGLVGSTDANGTEARFNYPTGIAIDGIGNLYVADANNHTIRKITTDGVVTTLAGGAGLAGSIDANGIEARFNYPTDIAIDGIGNVYVADSNNHTIRKITADGVVTTVAGKAGLSGSVNGAGTTALFNQPGGLALGGLGNVYVADTGNNTLRRITPEGIVTTFAGLPTIAGLKDGTGTAALFNQPQTLAFDSSGNLYVVDTGNAALRKVTSEGVVTTLSLSFPTATDATSR